jgi:hypothetical protein
VVSVAVVYGKMKVSEVINCSFSAWYPHFKKITTRSVVIPLDDDFITYLLADGIVLPDGSGHEYTFDKNSDDGNESDEVDWDSSDTDSVQAPSFPELDLKIKEAISSLGGKVFPKLNWSSPKDAAWILANGSTCCTSLGDIYLLLKSSDFITHDLTQPFKHCSDIQGESNKVQYTLVLRKWLDVNPGTEFRCFVKDNTVVGISQRDHHSFYPHIEVERPDIIQDIVSFFNEKICNRFPEINYVFDVQRICKDKVELMDFNPFGCTTDGLLFNWLELEEMSPDVKTPELRYISRGIGMQPFPYRHYAMPTDFVDLTTGEDPQKFLDLLRLRELKLGDNTSHSDDEEGNSTVS